jgi:hypothetical protein
MLEDRGLTWGLEACACISKLLPDDVPQIFLQRLSPTLDMLFEGAVDHGLIAAAAYVLTGNVMQAQEILADPRTKNLPFSLLAIIYASLGEKERGLELLEKAYEEREIALLVIIASPRGFLPAQDSLLDDPRFQALMKKIGLEN